MRLVLPFLIFLGIIDCAAAQDGKDFTNSLGMKFVRIDAGAFVFAEEFPDYRFIKNVAAAQKRRTCDQVFDEFLIACDSRVTKKDLAFVTARGYRKLLTQIWRPEIGPRIFEEIRYSELAKIANAYHGRRKPTTTPSAWFAAPSTTATETTRRSTTRPPVSVVCE